LLPDWIKPSAKILAKQNIKSIVNSRWTGSSQYPARRPAVLERGATHKRITPTGVMLVKKVRVEIMETIIVVSMNDVCRTESDDKTDESRGDLNTEGLEVVESKNFNDDTSERSKHPVECNAAEYNRNAHPVDRIEECFADVGPLNMMIGNTGVVDSDTFKGDITFSVVENACSGGVIGQE
jgi:hypothetical protein